MWLVWWGRLVCNSCCLRLWPNPTGISKITTLTWTDPKRKFGFRRHPSITPQEGTRTAIEALPWRHIAGKQILMRDARNVSPLACIRWHPSGCLPSLPKWHIFHPFGAARVSPRGSHPERGTGGFAAQAAGENEQAQSGMQKPVRTRRGRARAEASASSDDSVRCCESTQPRARTPRPVSNLEA